MLIMNWAYKLLMLLSSVLGSQESSLITVVDSGSGSFQVIPGHQTDRRWVVLANLTDTQTDTGWLHLDITSNKDESNKLQAKAAGFAEGYLTRDLIYHYYMEFIYKDLCGVSVEFCRWTKENLSRNQRWVLGKLQSPEGQTPYWKMVGLFITQLEGLRLGWVHKTEQDGFTASPNFDTKWFGLFINYYPDIGDYVKKFKKSLLKINKTKDKIRLRASLPSCSVLLKPRKEEREMLVGHSTWHEYRAMEFRLLKRYTLPFSLPRDGGIIPGHTVAMSSYAGTLFSLDDLYSTSGDLVVTETTLFVYNSSLMEGLGGGEKVVWEPVRVMLANRLATNGRQWVDLFGRHNSGTYNNQWMVVDMDLVRRGSTEQDVLWVLEQLPGKVESRDMTSSLYTQGYWGSYNRAAFQDIFRESGGQEMEERHGSWFSHSDTPRARILRKNQENVENVTGMMKLLRSNNYTTPDTNSVSVPPGCSGPIPQAAIAARGDLQDPGVTCSWESEDFMVGQRAYGAIDTKVMSAKLSQDQQMVVVAGPTSAENTLPPFSWSRSSFPVPDFRPVDTFNFKSFTVRWKSAETVSRTTTITPMTTTTTAHSTANIGSNPSSSQANSATLFVLFSSAMCLFFNNCEKIKTNA